MKIAALASLSLVGLAAAAPLQERAACSTYTIINTRGTGEIQGPSAGFIGMNKAVTSAIPGGSIYNTVYPAARDQNSTAGTQDIIRKVQSLVAADPSTCVILEGYSQGAAATVNALRSLTGPLFDAVKAMVLLGSPMHKAGLACNVDPFNGSSTLNVNGLSVDDNFIPDNWVSKTKDICIKGDGVCDTDGQSGITPPHTFYIVDPATQTLGATFIKAALRG